MDRGPRGSGTTSSISPLALPKGTVKLCELCDRRAHLQCNSCRVTFYCDVEHQRADWVGIHERICQLLIPIRTPTLQSLQRAGRIEMQLKKAELIEICSSEVRRRLSERKHQEALPAAQFCLRCAMEVHGPGSVQLVPAYLQLADANMGLSNLALATELLAQAEWVVLKSPECGPAVHQQLHRSLGHLHAASGHLDAALMHFANYIYFASEEHGPDSTVSCHGYFLMAGVFAKQGKMTIARSLYSTVAHTWHLHLTELLEARVRTVGDPSMPLERSHDLGQHAELDEMLGTMLGFEQDHPREDQTQMALVAHCLAVLWLLRGDDLKARGFACTALQASQLIPDPDLTVSIQGLLQLVPNFGD